MSTTIPPQGTHFSDGVRTGLILGTQFTAGASVLTPSSPVSSPVGSQPPGIYVTPTSLLDIIPATIAAAGIAALQTTGAAGYLTLASTDTIGRTVQANFGSVTGPAGASILKLSHARNFTLTSTGNISGVNFTVFGWDIYGMPMAELIVGPNNNTVAGAKAFKYIQAVYASGAVGTNTSVGYGDVFGLPYYLPNANYVFSQKYNGALDAGTIVAGVPATATSGTGDVRGTYAPASASDSVKRLTINMYAPSGDARLSNGSASSSVYLNTNAVVVATGTATVTAPNHQFTTGETVTISGCTGADAALANISATVTVVNANSFTYTAGGTGTSAATGTAILMTPAKGNLYISPPGRFGVTQYSLALI